MFAAWRLWPRAVVLAFTFGAGLCACSSLQVGLGMRTRLDKVPVVSITASLESGPALAPGRTARLIIVATDAGGKKWTTVGPGHGAVLFDSFQLTSSIVHVSRDGVVSMPADPKVSYQHPGNVHIAAVGHPDVTADLEVPARYNVAFAGHFSGQPGHDGFDGSTGVPGLDGTPGTTIGDQKGPGGNGTNGGPGSDGSDGGDGSPGETVHVWVTLLSGTGGKQLVQVRAAGLTHQDLYLIDPEGGSLTLDANGGAGGRGGNGGRGGRGGRGGTGSPNGIDGMEGPAGVDGRHGRDGIAGSFIVSVDPAAQPFMRLVHFVNRDGAGRPGPTPDIRVDTVGALW